MATRRPGLVAVSIGSSISIGLGVAFVALVAMNDRRTHPLVGAIAFGVLYAMPGILAVVGYRLRRPAMVLAATLAALALGVFLISIVVVVLLASCVCFHLAYARMRGAPRLRDVGIAILVVALTGASIPLLFLSEDPRCWAVVRRDGVERVVDVAPDVGSDGGIRLGNGRNGNEPRGSVESGCVSDVVSNSEGLGVLLVLSAAMLVALAVTGGRSRSVRDGPHRLPSLRSSITR
jgi:hypothetical protein